jgi:hypothetical protein
MEFETVSSMSVAFGLRAIPMLQNDDFQDQYLKII